MLSHEARMHLNVTHRGYCYRCTDEEAVLTLCRWFAHLGPQVDDLMAALVKFDFDRIQAS